MKRVAVLVHNEVFKDARVRKEAATLVAAGYKVDVFGITRTWTDHPSTVDGANVELLTDKSLKKSTKLLTLLSGKYAEGIGMLLALSSAALILSEGDTPWIIRLLLIIGLCALFLIGCLRRNSVKLRQRNFILKSLAAAIISAVTFASIYAYMLSPWDIVWVGACVWAILRLDPSPARLRSIVARLVEQGKGSAREVRYRELAELLANRVLAGNYDVVHCHDMIALIAGARIKRAKPAIKLIWDAHEIYEDMANGRPQDKLMIQRIIKQSQGFVDQFITINKSIAQFYERYYSLPQARIVMNATNHNGPVTYDGRLHRAAGLRPERKILLFQGGLAPHRGISQLMDAASNLPPGWSVVVMGWGKMQPEIEERVMALSTEVAEGEAPLSLIPPAPQEELAMWTSGATLGAIPYENVGLNHLYCTPNKLWEYPNAGVPIVASSLEEMAAMISEWGTGFLLPREFSGQDIIDLIGAITSLEIEEAKEQCQVFSEAMSWAKFEPEILLSYSTFEQPSKPT